ncbi:methylamine utilization protein [Massilia sp. TWP1-3-3]|uniref:methylamine utilization protein n=1 Tax=Massilia sp. TWP1-3-3 TaxID=2804573 RepID=UPI003CE8AE6B
MKLPFRPALLATMCLAAYGAHAGALTVQVSDSAGKPLADAVVVVDAEGGVAMPRVLTPGQIEQRGLKFLPLVTVIQTGSRVSFPNNDKVKHHIYSFSPAKKFDQKLYSGVTAAPQVFEKAGLVVLGCNIHDRMVSYVKVVDSPYFAKTDAAGVARIEVPAAGKYTVTAWHYQMSGAIAEQSVALRSEAPSALSFKLPLKPPPIGADAQSN